MKRLLLSALLVLPLSLSAQDLVEFQNGQVADAEDINTNFSSLKEAIDALSVEAGATLLTGEGLPLATSGAVGDVYIDTLSYEFYGPKLESGWGVGVSLVGPTGLTGADGPEGPQGADGPEGPQGATGAIGPKGDTGDTGAVGPQGPKGDTGDTGAVGPQGPAGADGEDTPASHSDGTNTAVGSLALSNNTPGVGNTASGYQALYSNTIGDFNTAGGYLALYSNTMGDFNTAGGYQALYSNTTGNFNTASGYRALDFNTTGSFNTASGYLALYRNTAGSFNTASGYQALDSNTTGINNTAVGRGADVTSGGLINATAIGYDAIVDASNKVRIGNTAVTIIEGNVAFTSSSDKRLKEDIQTVDKGLEFINDLTPVSYKRINNEAGTVEMGLLAQDVAATLAKYGLSDSGMVHQANEDAYMSLRYNDLLAPMIKAIQELSEESKTLTAQTTSLQQQSKAKDKTIAELQKSLEQQQDKLETQQQEMIALLKQQQDQIASLKRIVERDFVVASD